MDGSLFVGNSLDVITAAVLKDTIMQSKIESLVAMLNAKFSTESGYSLHVSYGKRYAKVILNHYGSDSAWMFIDLDNGAVYKADSWVKPAKGIRYWLITNDDISRLVSVADPYGRFLYAR
jgi:hypothetical protein